MEMKSNEQMDTLTDQATYLIEGLVMEGSIEAGNHPVIIEGHFKGDIKAVEVIIRAQGTIDGVLKAQTALISGHFKGDLVCENLTVTQSGVVEGDVQANALSIDLGAEVIGSISRIT